MKNDENPLTAISDKAQEMVQALEASILSEYGLPLHVKEQGDVFRWPEDPEKMSPEEMAVLLQIRGEDAVNKWLGEFYSLRADVEGDE